MCEDGAGQFHHGKATNRIGSTLISLSGISLAGLLTFLWVMHRNVGYNANIFLCRGGKECVRKHPSYMRSPSYFAALLQIPYFYYSKVHAVGFRQHFELERPSNCEINRWVSRWEFSSAAVSYVALKQVARGMVCLSESHRGLNFRDVICARRYRTIGC